MPTQPPHRVSSLPRWPKVSPEHRETKSTLPKTQIYETNPIKTTPDAIGPPLYLTPTEVGDTAPHTGGITNRANTTAASRFVPAHRMASPLLLNLRHHGEEVVSRSLSSLVNINSISFNPVLKGSAITSDPKNFYY